MTPWLRDRSTGSRTTNIELFFDLVYVFAVTQLSHFLLDHPSAAGALRAALLLAMVWLVWAYTTWVTNWLDPERLPVRGMLLASMLGGLALSAGLPDAFGRRGLEVGVAYAAMQVGRSGFAVVALAGDRLQRNFERILAWCVVSGTLAVVGGIAHGHAREACWLAAVGVDVLGGAVGFATPGLGRSTTADWTIEGSHFAERCQAFILIALGEAVVVIGARWSGLTSITGEVTVAATAAFAGCVALWWLYFDRSADDASRVIAGSDDPGRLGRSAYHLIHPLMVAGVIVVSAADERVLAAPARATAATSWMVLGGTALFVIGHALFKAAVWKDLPRSRLAGVVALAVLAAAAPHVPPWALSALATAVVIAIAAGDRARPVTSGRPAQTHPA